MKVAEFIFQQQNNARYLTTTMCEKRYGTHGLRRS